MTKKQDPEQILQSVRQKLRGIVRKLQDASLPLHEFRHSQESPPRDVPYAVRFSKAPTRSIQGLKIKTASVNLPDIAIEDELLEIAAGLWHLKDYVKRWCKAEQYQFDVEQELKACSNLLICADLANRKKHGGNDNRSGLDPHLGLTRFDTSNSGLIELFYDGLSRDKELYVSDRQPIHISTPILDSGEAEITPDAIVVFRKAFREWISIFRKTSMLSGLNRESSRICEILRNVPWLSDLGF